MTLPEGREKCQKNTEESSPEGTPAKKQKLDENPPNKSYWEPNVSLLDLSDDVLLLICYYLRSTDLLALSQCCTRLEEVVCDRTLWINVDFRQPLLDLELQKFLKFFLPTTKSITTHGFKNEVTLRNADSVFAETPLEGASNEELNDHTNSSIPFLPSDKVKKPSRTLVPEVISLTHNFVQCLNQAAPNLKEFIAENHLIDASQLQLDHFPTTIEHLSFKNSEIFGVSRCKSYFSGFDIFLPNIECLNLSHCRWFTSHSLLALSKSKTLKKLILYGCHQIDDCVPYVSLSFRFGFAALTVLDLRKTMISDRELGCFNSNITLRELYLEAPEDNGGGLQVTDMGITMFGNVTDLVQNRANIPNMVVLLMIGHLEQRSGTPSPLKKLVVRNYTLVTDTSLKHAAGCLINLTYIDITGTSCSEEGVAIFKTKRPNVTIISDYESNYKQ